ncbi:hypothetical protein JJB09_04210 [Rhizobium sp. KVB221]|uniref:Calcium-binding protein n=1 Tax=Rhizobium setariae TaxID=2801340 RepID=A0A936YN72_9HYPH|nr:hypothetical protein [Rhizobium setariae]MBL0371224.1 hypothetical protein [Rhizobium setariae]
MATFNAYKSFDLQSIDMSWLVDNFYSRSVKESSNDIIDGITYEDKADIFANDGSSYLGLRYYGNMTFGTGLWETGGTVSLIVSVATDSTLSFDEIVWSMGNVEISAIDLEAALLTPNTFDEHDLIRAALAGDDDVNLSDYMDIFDGMGGDDLINGGGGDDQLNGDDGDDTINGGSGNEFIDGGSGNDFVSGDVGLDSLYGDSGQDIMLGGSGKDTMSGGEDNDEFRFTSQLDSGNKASTADIITDFKHRFDEIDVHEIDASVIRGGENAFIWRGTGAISTSTHGEIRFQKFNNAGSSNDYTMIYFDTDKDKASEFLIKLTGLEKLDAHDFIL